MMKPLLISLVALFLTGTVANAQNLEFFYHGESLPDKATVTIPAEENDFGELACYTNPSSAGAENGLVLKFNGTGFGSTVMVEATLTILHNTLDVDLLKWCMGGNCYYMNDVEALFRQIEVPRGQKEPIEFDAEGINATGYLKAELDIKYGDEHRYVYILFTNGETGIDAITHNPSLNTQYYTLDGRRLQEEPAQKGVYIQNGKKIIIK